MKILNSLDESTKQIRDLIINSEFPAEMREEILETYETLSFTDYDIKESEALEILEANSEPVLWLSAQAQQQKI